MNECLVLFAQQNRPPDAAGPAFAFAMICVQVLAMIVGIGMAIFFYITAYKALSAVSPRNREMDPGMIFLMLIPCFGTIWYFFVVIRIAASFEKEFRDRGLQEDGDFGRLLGILAPLIPCVGIVLFIMWIMKVRGYTAQLEAGGGGKRPRRLDDDEDDDDDDRPRSKRRSRDDD